MDKAKSEKKSTIEINGRLYNASNGHAIGWSPSHHDNQPVSPSEISLDGVVNKPSLSRPVSSHAKRKPARSQTLMRSSVTKPRPKLEGQSNSPGINNPKPKRQKRAKEISRNPQIKHFTSQEQATHARPKQIYRKPTQARPEHVAEARTETQPLPRSPKPSSSINLDEIINQADSHLEPAVQPKKRNGWLGKKSSLAAATAALLLLMGFFTWQNQAQIQIRLAASEANIPASLPGYLPDGYRLTGPIETESGEVTLSFSSEDERDFTISQRASDWDNDSLYANHIQPNSISSQTYEENDRTIYLTDQSNANWIENGIWYKLEGNGQLNSDELIRIATSL